MATRTLKFLNKTGMFIFLLAFSSYNYAGGPIIEVLDRTIEFARITISTEDSNTEGTLTVEFIGCNSCTPQTYSFDSSTVLINQLEAERPIKELKSWSGNKAMVRYRKADGHVKTVKILP